MHHPTDRIAHTTAFVIPVVEHWLEREIAQWVHLERSIRRPITPWANSYHGATSRSHLTHFILRLYDVRGSYCKSSLTSSQRSSPDSQSVGASVLGCQHRGHSAGEAERRPQPAAAADVNKTRQFYSHEREREREREREKKTCLI